MMANDNILLKLILEKETRKLYTRFDGNQIEPLESQIHWKSREILFQEGSAQIWFQIGW